MTVLIITAAVMVIYWLMSDNQASMWSVGIIKPAHWKLIPWIRTYETVKGWRFSWLMIVVERVVL